MNLFNKSKGFTLLEVIIAIGIIIVAIVALLEIINYSLSRSRVSANKLIAANLAQEAVEAVRSDRDASGSWSNWIKTMGDPEKQYAVVVNRGSINRLWFWEFIEVDGADLYLSFDPATGFYVHCSSDFNGYGDCSSVETTSFERLVTISEITKDSSDWDYPDDHQPYAKVRVEIKWQENDQDNSLVVISQLHDWKKLMSSLEEG